MRWQSGETRFIDQHLLVRSLQEGANLLCIAPGRKSLLLDGESHQLFEVVGLGIGEATLPVAHGAAGDAQVPGQIGLCQTDRGAQGQEGLSKGVVSVTV